MKPEKFYLHLFMLWLLLPLSPPLSPSLPLLSPSSLSQMSRSLIPCLVRHYATPSVMNRSDNSDDVFHATPVSYPSSSATNMLYMDSSEAADVAANNHQVGDRLYSTCLAASLCLTYI